MLRAMLRSARGSSHPATTLCVDLAPVARGMRKGMAVPCVVAKFLTITPCSCSLPFTSPTIVIWCVSFCCAALPALRVRPPPSPTSLSYVLMGEITGGTSKICCVGVCLLRSIRVYALSEKLQGPAPSTNSHEPYQKRRRTTIAHAVVM